MHIPTLKQLLTLSSLLLTGCLLSFGWHSVAAQEPSAQPAQPKIVFSSDRDRDREIYAMNIDGTNVIRLTNERGFDNDPVWSPDGSRILYISADEEGRNLYVMNADGSNRVLLDIPNFPYAPSWSPDGSQIAFLNRSETTTELYVMNADGSGQRVLAGEADGVYVGGGRLAWSPDSSQIAFGALDAEGNSALYVINVDGTGKTLLVDTEGYDISPAWSPDGNRIAFVSAAFPGFYASTAGDIYLINADGQALVSLHTPGLEPTWSPDGSQLLFFYFTEGATIDHLYDIVVMNGDGTGRQVIGEGANPDWAQ